MKEGNEYQFLGVDMDALAAEHPNAAFVFSGTVGEFAPFLRVCNEVYDDIQNTQSLRNLVLQAWLLLDYAVRDLLVTAFDIRRFSTSEFDPRFYCLPRSFAHCLDTLRALRREFVDKPRPFPERLQPPRFPEGQYAMYLLERRPELWEALIEMAKAHADYIREMHPEHLEEYVALQQSVVTTPRRHIPPDHCLDVIAKLSDSWFSTARRLNVARNKAAHSLNESAIASKLGISGPQMLDHVRRSCTDLLRDLLVVGNQD